MLAVAEDGVFLLRDAHPAEFARKVGEVGDLDASDVVEIPRVIAVAANPEGDPPDPARDVVHLLMKPMPDALVRERAGGQHFDGHVAFEVDIVGAIDFAHPACTDTLENAVVAQRLADHQEMPAVV